MNLHRSGRGAFEVDGYVHMAAAHAVPQHLADARLKDVKTLRQTNAQIEKSVIHAAQADAQQPTVFFDLRLRITGHGADGCCKLACGWRVHDSSRSKGGPAAEGVAS